MEIDLRSILAEAALQDQTRAFSGEVGTGSP